MGGMFGHRLFTLRWATASTSLEGRGGSKEGEVMRVQASRLSWGGTVWPFACFGVSVSGGPHFTRGGHVPFCQRGF